MLIYTEEKSNVPFYTKHGFSVMENGAAIQICNYGNLNENLTDDGGEIYFLLFEIDNFKFLELI